MTGFPDESRMLRSEDGSEPIRGGSIAFNRILGLFVDAANKDHKPRFNAVLISGFTIFRNIWQMNEKVGVDEQEQRFANDVNLFMEYFETYLEIVWSTLSGDKFCPVVIYFPSYKTVPKDILREQVGRGEALSEAYKKFRQKHGSRDGEIKQLRHCRCFTIRVGDTTYPHREIVQKFRNIAAHPQSLYTSGDPVALITHITLDYYIGNRMRNVMVIESHTARIRKPDEFRLRLDKEGRVPFQPSVHIALGDKDLIKPLVSPKIRKEILETAGRERWVGRGDVEIRGKIMKITGLPTDAFLKYDFL